MEVTPACGIWRRFAEDELSELEVDFFLIIWRAKWMSVPCCRRYAESLGASSGSNTHALLVGLAKWRMDPGPAASVWFGDDRVS